MSPSVLIAYATLSGSTGEVANAIAASIRDCGLEAQVLPVQQVETLEGTHHLILGAALYAGSFPKEFKQFIARHRAVLEGLRPWIFVLGPTENEPRQFEGARGQALRQLAKCPWLQPADVRILGGKFDPATLKLRFPFNFAFRLPGNPMRKMQPIDIRDWNAIRAWARSIADTLRTAA